MTTAIIAPANGDHKRPQGHCSKCRKVWTLATENGVCHWCGKPSTCQTIRTNDSRGIKTSRTRKQRQTPAIDNGYDQLDGEWLTYYKVASRFNHKAKVEDTEDLLHDIILTLAVAKRNNGHKPFTEAVMYRIASYTQAHYWYKHYKLTMGLDCGHCSKSQRHKCRENWLYGDCPKAIKLDRLNKPILDNEGHTTALGDLIADDKALDLDAWLDARTFLLSCPHRLVQIAQKRLDGIPLNNADKLYLGKWRKREQKRLL